MAAGRILVIGAHPDDCDFKAGGTAALWRRHGLEVQFVSMTNGCMGHHQVSGLSLADRRRAEATAAGNVIGIKYQVLDNDDGRLQPTLENRLKVVRLIREFQPDLVLTHRPNDYHPDHRYTSQLVQDAAYMVTVPFYGAETPFLKTNPIFGYLSDHFRRPYEFSADVVVPIDDVLPLVVEMLHCHESQFYEWLPFNQGIITVPTNEAERKAFLKEWFLARFAVTGERYRSALIAEYGEERGRSIEVVEAFEISEYGSPLTPAARKQLFPFVFDG